MHSLEELHLINLDELENNMNVMVKNIDKLEHLRVLDVRNNMWKRDITALVPLLANNSNKNLVEVDMSPAIISKNNMLSLWMALHYNVNVCKLTYSRINFFALDEIAAIDLEIAMNVIIRDEVKPKVESCLQRNLKKAGNTSSLKNQRREVSLSGFHFTKKTNPAVIKYIKS